MNILCSLIHYKLWYFNTLYYVDHNIDRWYNILLIIILNFWVWQKLRANRWANQLCFKHHHRLSNMVCANIICSCLWSCFSTWLKTSKHFVKQKSPPHISNMVCANACMRFDVWWCVVSKKSLPQTEFDKPCLIVCSGVGI